MVVSFLELLFWGFWGVLRGLGDFGVLGGLGV